MYESLTRRGFMSGTLCAMAMAAIPGERAHGEAGAVSSGLPQPAAGPNGLPLVDLHAHLDNSTIDAVAALGQERGITLGIVEHAGIKENDYPVVLSNDEELLAYIAMLDGKPVFKGVQAEYDDWFGCFSREALAKLDYILTDAMTLPGPDGRRQKQWEKDVEYGEVQAFMDRYVDWHVRLMDSFPIDIFANVSWLPGPFAQDYDALWTETRVAKVVDTAARRGVAIEISSGFILPKLAFLKQAKAAGVKFSFGTNGRYPKMAVLDYSLEMAAALELTASDIFVPGQSGTKAVLRH